MYHPKVINAQRAALETQFGMELRDYTPEEVKEFAWRMRNVDWTPGMEIVLGQQAPEIRAYVANELLLCKIDFLYWCTRYAHIIDDAANLSTLYPRPSQEKFLSVLKQLEGEAWDRFQSDPRLKTFVAKLRIILAKARQVGGTVIAEALLAHLTLLGKNTRSLIASDDIRSGSPALYRKFTTIYDNLPPWMRPEAETRVKATNMHFGGVNSDLIVGGGNQRNSLGQGMTIDAAHLTEMSTWLPDVAEAVDEDLIPAFNSSLRHHSLLLIESTGAGGAGNWFHDRYHSAVRKTSQFSPVFLGWHSCPDKFALFDDALVLNEHSLNLAKRLAAEENIHLTREQLNWYQVTRTEYEAAHKLQKFLQEYPSTADEAFQAGLVSVFSLELRNKTRNACRAPKAVFDVIWETGKLVRVDLDKWNLSDDPDKHHNRVILWEMPRPGFTYVMGIDVSYGIDGRDYSSIQIVRVGNRWECDEQVAELCGRVTPALLGRVAWTLGYIYTDGRDGLPALAAIEVFPGPGLVVQVHLQERGYPNFYVMRKPNKVGGGYSNEYGWRTTDQSRNHLVEQGIEGIKSGCLKINSPAVVDEMGTFIVTVSPSGRRRVEHAATAHDDNLLALFIAYYVAHESDVSSIAEVRMQNWQQELARASGRPATTQFQNMTGNWQTLVSEWEQTMEAQLGW